MSELSEVPKEVLDRFWAKVDKSGECWIWTGARNQHGYGNFAIRRGKTCRPHRLSYEWLVGDIAPQLVIDHLCRNRACVNPEHLEPVTNRENLLRGMGATGTKARQTHCTWGHEFTPENTNIKKNGCRECKACASRRSSEKWQRIKAKSKGEAA